MAKMTHKNRKITVVDPDPDYIRIRIISGSEKAKVTHRNIKMLILSIF
jgi:hypothetical protein